MRSAVVAVALLGAGSVAGCGSSSPAAAPRSPTVTPSTILRVSGSGPGICLDAVGGDFGYWNGEVTATQALEITAVRLDQGSDVELRGGTGVRVIRPVTGGSGLAPWPMSGPGRLAHEVGWSTRSGLIGLRMKAGETVLPIIHVHAQPGGRLDTVELGYRTTGGQTGTTVLSTLFKLSRETC